MTKLTHDVVLEDFFKIASKIENPAIRKFVYEGFNMISEDFWMVPTSSSGRYHPPESNITPMGLLVHNIKACTVAKGLFGFFGVTNKDEMDIVIAAILLHDSYKGGWAAWNGMVPEHGYIAISYLADIELEPEYYKEKLLGCIETHMSRWARPFSSVTKFLFPDNLQLIVALSDMIASRKDISFYPGISVLELGGE
jgi:hypothetical protein